SAGAPAAEREANRRQAIQQMRRHLDEMRHQLPADKQERLDKVTAQFEALFDSFDAARFSELQAAFEDEFDLPAVTLVPRRYYPLIRTLSWQEAAFMAFYVFGMIYVAVSAARWRRHSPRPMRAFLILILLAGGSGWLWHHFVPA